MRLPSLQAPKLHVEAATRMHLPGAALRPGLGALVEGCVHAVGRLFHGFSWVEVHTFPGAAGKRLAAPSATSATP